MADYKEMKTLNKVDRVTVYWSNTEFRRYSIEVKNRLGEYVYQYTNHKPTIKELREIKERMWE